MHNRPPMQKITILLAILLIATQAMPAFAQQKNKAIAPPKTAAKPVDATAAKFNLTIDAIMRGNELVGYEPRAVRWSGDQQHIYFQWKQYSDSRDKDYDTYVIQSDGTGLHKLTDEEAKNAPPLFGEDSKDKRLTLFTEGGDVYLYDYATNARRQITATTEIESNAHFTRDQKSIYFTRANNLYVMTLESGSLAQMTNIPAPTAQPATGGGGAGFGGGQQGQRGGNTGGAASAQQRGTESQEYLKKEEQELLDIVKRRAQKRQEDEERRKQQNPRKPLQLQATQTVANLQLTPDGKNVIATVIEAPVGSKNTVVPNYVTESGYTEDIPGRTNVGDTQSRSRLAILEVTTGEVKWVEHGQKQIAPTNEAQQARQRTETKSESQGEGQQRTGAQQASEPRRDVQQQAQQGQNQTRDRDVQLFQPVWSDDGTKAVFQARAADNKDRWILALDPATGKTRVIATDHDDAWINGPGAFTLGWLKDNNRIYFQSERDGYSHLYAINFDGSDLKQLTNGKWEVTNVQLSDDKSKFYLTTSEVHPGERHFYAMNTDGGERVKITSMPGSNLATLSRDEKRIALIYSFSNKPPELYVQENRGGDTAKKLTSSPSPEFWQYNWIEPPIITFKARDGAEVPARFYKPANFKRGGPAVVFVHGAGYAQNVHRYWASYYREYMFHHFLMENGYCVIDVDYRASSGYGRDWRAGIYRHMGGKDLDDQVDAAKWLVAEQGVDARRIGIYGGSYGGFITLMALFTQPDVFAAGAALRPVTDWAHYNHGYTSNILNTPQKDAEAYKQSSPIYFAQNLKGALLICHGMVDTNVHFQDSVRLVQRLIELRKENWELAVYPVEDHGFLEPTSWADEYKRIFKLFETNLKKGLALTK
jgi:dipeptidyl aminopeptidase/acylaminoacyl peptidase